MREGGRKGGCEGGSEGGRIGRIEEGREGGREEGGVGDARREGTKEGRDMKDSGRKEVAHEVLHCDTYILPMRTRAVEHPSICP